MVLDSLRGLVETPGQKLQRFGGQVGGLVESFQKNKQMQNFKAAGSDLISLIQSKGDATSQDLAAISSKHDLSPVGMSALLNFVKQSNALGAKKSGSFGTVGEGGIFNKQTGEVTREPAAKTTKRRILQDNQGINRYVDTGDPVFPSTDKSPNRKTARGADGFLYYTDGEKERVFPGLKGKETVLQDTLTGQPLVVSPDKTKARALQVDEPEVEGITGQPAPESKQEAPSQTIWELTDLGTGPGSAVRAGGSVVTGNIGLPVAEKTIQARQFISSAQNDLIRALSINPRFPVGEINRLQKEINISPKFFDNPKSLRARAKAVNDFLNIRLSKEKKASRRTSGLPLQQRRNARAAANDIENFIELLGVPPTISESVYKNLNSGDQYYDEQGRLREKR